MLNALILAAVTATTPVADTTDDPCVPLGDTAYRIMSLRQNGAPMSDLMAISNGSDLFRSMVMDAYRAPRMSLDQNRTELAEDFRTAIELMCYEAMSK